MIWRGLNTDRAEDDEIHCLKEGEVAADARETIRIATLDTADESEESDPFADIEDEDELEENELVLDDCYCCTVNAPYASHTPCTVLSYLI